MLLSVIFQLPQELTHKEITFHATALPATGNSIGLQELLKFFILLVPH